MCSLKVEELNVVECTTDFGDQLNTKWDNPDLDLSDTGRVASEDFNHQLPSRHCH